ncbi:hypothetical protein OKW49_001761 [Paraburkholderia youngii]
MSSRVAAPTRCRIGEARVRGPSNPLTVNVVQFRCVCQPAVALCGSRRFERKFTVGTGPLAVGAANRKRRYSHWHSGKPSKRQRGVLEQKRNAIRILESVARQIELRWRQPLCCCPHCLRARPSRPVGPTRCRPAEPERFGGLSVPTRDIFDLVEQGAKVEPRQLCSRLLHKFRIRPCLDNGAPLLQVAKRSSLRGPKRTPRSVTDHRSDRGRTASSPAGPYCANIVGQRPLRFHRQEPAPETEKPQQPVVQCGDTGLRASHGHVEQPKL